MTSVRVLMLVGLAFAFEGGSARCDDELCTTERRASDHQVWPLVRADGLQPVATTFEFIKYEGSATLHEGFDLPGQGAFDANVVANSDCSWVIAAADSYLEDQNLKGIGVIDTSILLVDDPDPDAPGREYLYGHLLPGSLDPDADLSAKENGGFIPAGTHLAVLGTWSPCSGGAEFDHLHFDVRLRGCGATRRLFPFRSIGTFADHEPPVVKDVTIVTARDMSAVTNPACPWQPVSTVPGGCVVVDGVVDILAEISDTDRGGAGPEPWDQIAPRSVRYRACPESEPNCSGWLTLFDNMSFPVLESGTRYDVSSSSCSPYGSSSDYCAGDRFVYVVSNATDEGPVTSASWDPAALSSPFVTLTVEAEDFAGNVGSKRVPVCVAPGGDCHGKLLLRDCDADTGAEPSDCPVSAAPDVGEVEGGLRVCASNAGCGMLDQDESIEITLRSETNTALSMSASAPAWEWLDPDDGSVAGSWPAGAMRCLVVSTPAQGTFSGPLSITVSRTGDVANASTGVIWDNNRASWSRPPSDE